MPASSDPNSRHKCLLDNPAILSAVVRTRDQVVLRTSLVVNATAFEVKIGTMPGVWKPAGIYDADSEIVIGGLVQGLDYSICARALGAGSASAWSDRVLFKSQE